MELDKWAGENYTNPKNYTNPLTAIEKLYSASVASRISQKVYAEAAMTDGGIKKERNCLLTNRGKTMSKNKVQCTSCWKVYVLEYKPRGKPICTACQRNGYWAAQDGDILHVTKMTNSHLINLSNFLARKAQEKYNSLLISGYTMSSFVQGEMAQVAVWDGIEKMENEGHWTDIFYSYSIVEPLEKEIENRGLTNRGKV